MNCQNIFSIVIPTINRADLLNEALKIYEVSFPHTPIIILNNGNQLIRHSPNVTVHHSPSNIGVAASWNFLCQQAFYSLKNSYALVLNDDIQLASNEQAILELLKMMDSEVRKQQIREASFLCHGPGGMNAFIIGVTAFKLVGLFDEQFFPAYFEDNDYLYRMKLQGVPVEMSMRLKSSVFVNSGSIAKDPSLNRRFDLNKQYYIAKWGGPPGYECFKIPFNKK